MTNEQINRAVAEELGWADVRERYMRCPWLDGIAPGESEYRLTKVPDFCTDHNAAAEIRRAIRPEERTSYTSWLLRVVVPDDRRPKYDFTPFDVINASPRQQAEAFLKMRGKWKE